MMKLLITTMVMIILMSFTHEKISYNHLHKAWRVAQVTYEGEGVSANKRQRLANKAGRSMKYGFLQMNKNGTYEYSWKRNRSDLTQGTWELDKETGVITFYNVGHYVTAKTRVLKEDLWVEEVQDPSVDGVKKIIYRVPDRVPAVMNVN